MEASKKIRINNYDLIIERNKITLVHVNGTYTASYPDIGDLREVDESLFHLMMYILLYNMEEVKLPEVKNLTNGNEEIVSYSGGVDSTALLYLTNGIPIHIVRSYDLNYENRQIRAVKSVKALEIVTDFEKIRVPYVGKHGFNVVIGYIAMYIPILSFLKADTMSLGDVFDYIAFTYDKELKYSTNIDNSAAYKIKKVFNQYGIKVLCPLAGYSEVLTLDLAINSGIEEYSSCHTVGSSQECRSCFKCFRKEAIKGNPLAITPHIKSLLMRVLKEKPLIMAACTVYAIQKAGYKEDYLQRFMNIDVSWLERVNKSLTLSFDGIDYSDFYDCQTKEDAESINNFVTFMNKSAIYEY